MGRIEFKFVLFLFYPTPLYPLWGGYKNKALNILQPRIVYTCFERHESLVINHESEVLCSKPKLYCFKIYEKQVKKQ